MRTRSLKHGFFQNEKLADLPALTRLLFQGLWLHADREGRLEDRPRKLKVAILPYDDCDVDAMLNQLADAQFIVRYAVNGQNYLSIPTFLKHQRPHPKEPASVIPAPEPDKTRPRQSREKSRLDHDKSGQSPEKPGPVALTPIPSSPSVPSDTLTPVPSGVPTSSGADAPVADPVEQPKGGESERGESETPTPSPKKPPDPYLEEFAAVYKGCYHMTYRWQRPKDFAQYSKLREETNGELTLEGWSAACRNYLATPQDSHTLAQLCTKFDTFQAHPIDRYNKPVKSGRKGVSAIGGAEIPVLKAINALAAKRPDLAPDLARLIDRIECEGLSDADARAEMERLNVANPAPVRGIQAGPESRRAQGPAG